MTARLQAALRVPPDDPATMAESQAVGEEPAEQQGEQRGHQQAAEELGERELPGEQEPGPSGCVAASSPAAVSPTSAVGR